MCGTPSVVVVNQIWFIFINIAYIFTKTQMFYVYIYIYGQIIIFY